ncbi:MAG: ABC transporter ATP-binding protein [Lysobacteraceae bacterium]
MNESLLPPIDGTSMTPPLACRGLGVTFEHHVVLADVCLEVRAGSVLGLIGRNGAGKTTLIRSLLGLQSPGAGEARLFGAPATAVDDVIRQRLGYVAQSSDAFQWMTVRDLLAVVGACYRRWDREWVDAMLDRWSLDAGARVSTLSPGERQRLALVRAMAHSPELLVLDEPASALDPVGRRELLREIVQRAGQQGTTVLLSTHIVSDLERVASDIALLDAGRLLLSLPLDQWKEDLRRLHVPRGLVDRVRARLPGELARHPNADGSLRMLVRREGGRWPELAGEPGVVHDTPGLEDVLVEVAG